MRVISTNLAAPTTIIWKGKTEQTGIYKTPTEHIFLGATDVDNDLVVDRKYHGGIHKACYLYSADHYEYWKSLYPNLDWHYGMFGENITVEGLNEHQLFMGSTYEIGTAIIKISEPRLPCYKLGIRFGTQKVVKQFMNTSFCGAYVSVIQKGKVQPSDSMKLMERGSALSMADIYSLYKPDERSTELLEKALNDPFIHQELKESISRK